MGGAIIVNQGPATPRASGRPPSLLSGLSTNTEVADDGLLDSIEWCPGDGARPSIRRCSVSTSRTLAAASWGAATAARPAPLLPVAARADRSTRFATGLTAICIQMSDGTFADPVKIGPSTEMGRIYGADGYRYDPWSQSRVHEVDHDGDGRGDLVFWNEDHFEVHAQDERGLFAPVGATITTEVAFDSDQFSSLGHRRHAGAGAALVGRPERRRRRRIGGRLAGGRAHLQQAIELRGACRRASARWRHRVGAGPRHRVPVGRQHFSSGWTGTTSTATAGSI